MALSMACHAAAEAEGRDHQAREAEHRLGVNEALALDAAEQVLGGHEDVLEDDRRGVRRADAVLVLVLARDEPRRALLDQKEGRSVGSRGQHRVKLGETAVGDELLGAVDFVALELAVFEHPVGLGSNGRQLAARQRLGHGVGDDQTLVADAAKPVLALLLGGAHHDGIGAEKDGEKGRGHAEVEAGHLLGHAVDVVGRASEPTQLLGNEQEVKPDLRAEQLLDETERKLVLVVELETNIGWAASACRTTRVCRAASGVIPCRVLRSSFRLLSPAGYFLDSEWASPPVRGRTMLA